MEFKVGDNISKYFQIKKNEKYFIAEFKEEAKEIKIDNNNLAFQFDNQIKSYKQPKYGGFPIYYGDNNLLVEIREKGKDLKYKLLNKEELFKL